VSTSSIGLEGDFSITYPRVLSEVCVVPVKAARSQHYRIWSLRTTQTSVMPKYKPALCCVDVKASTLFVIRGLQWEGAASRLRLANTTRRCGRIDRSVRPLFLAGNRSIVILDAYLASIMCVGTVPLDDAAFLRLFYLDSLAFCLLRKRSTTFVAVTIRAEAAAADRPIARRHHAYPSTASFWNVYCERLSRAQRGATSMVAESRSARGLYRALVNNLPYYKSSCN